MEQNLDITAEIFVITSTIQNPKRKLYLDITSKCQHATIDIKAQMVLTAIIQGPVVRKSINANP